MPHVDAEPPRSMLQSDRLDLAYYQFCCQHGRPYFGRVMSAAQGLPLRHVVMQELIRIEADRLQSGRFHILEVGSWAGGSAITWAEAIKRHQRGNGFIICVDPWEPYFDLTKRPNAPVYREMFEALATDTIYDLFLHNVKAAGHDDIVMPIRGNSTAILPTLPRGYFDLVFIDGDHSYAAVSADLKAATGLIKDGGILCGDDLELQLPEIDLQYARTQMESDYVRDPRSGREYHPGVTLAVGELIGSVSSVVGCWAVRRRGDKFERIDMSVMSAVPDRIPAHLARQEPKIDPVFQAWLARRNWEAGQRQGSSVALHEFMEQISSRCEQREFESAFEHYDRLRRQFEATSELLEFDQIIHNIREQLEILKSTVVR